MTRSTYQAVQKAESAGVIRPTRIQTIRNRASFWLHDVESLPCAGVPNYFPADDCLQHLDVSDFCGINGEDVVAE